SIFDRILLWIPFCVAFYARQGPCPNMTAVGDFDMERFLGTWYTYSIYTPVTTTVARCQKTEFIQYDANFYKMKSLELSTQTDTVKVRQALIKEVDSSKGRYIQETHNKVLPEGVQIYILDTDYDNFAIRFMCFEALSIFSFHWAVIQTRKRLPNAGIIYVAQELAKKNGIAISHMSKVHQESCPRDS
ncbi:hypothetical protein KR026_002185, partial [Drosophila bipectinata]